MRSLRDMVGFLFSGDRGNPGLGDRGTPGQPNQGGSAVSHVVGVFTVNNACTGNETIQYTATGPVCTMTPISLPASFTITGQATCFCS